MTTINSVVQTPQERQKALTAKLDAELARTEQYCEAGSVAKALKSLAKVEVLLKQLETHTRTRRGLPRRRAGIWLRYYLNWHDSLDARLQIANNDYRPSMAFRLLTQVSVDATALAKQYWSTPEFVSLARRIDTWLEGVNQQKLSRSA